MGWKRFEKECRKAGKSVEKESKKVVEKINDELTRVAQRQIKNKTDSSSPQVEVQPAVVIPLQPVVEPIQQVPSEPIEKSNKEEINTNPEGLRPGRAYLINHLTFDDPLLQTRTGSEEDVKRLRRIFKLFGMKVRRVRDGTLSDIKNVMEKISKYDFQNLGCLVIVIMSHGQEGNIIAAKDSKYSLDHDIMYPILRNRSLTSKLKLLVTQSCKGYVNPMLEIEGPKLRPTVIPSEILQLTSCVEGYVSYLDRQHGSIFISTLCDHLEKSGLKENILDIAAAVVKDVKRKYYDIQIPMYHSNLTKQFVFGHFVTDHIEYKEGQDNSDSEEECISEMRKLENDRTEVETTAKT